MAYITQFYEWATGNTMTAARLNGNITNIVDALAGGTKDINCLTVEIGGTTVVDNSENFISTSKYNLNADGTAIDAAGAITYGAGQDAAIYWDGTSNVIQQTTALTSTVSYNKFSHITSGTPANGIGVGLQLEVETAAGNNEIGVVLDAVTTDVTSTSEDFDFVIKCMAAGAAASEVGRFQSDGKLDLVSGAEYQIAGTDVLSATTLGSGVVASSLTSVGTLTSLTVDNVVINGNDISSSSGNLTITPVAGSAVVIDGGASFDGTVLTGLTALTSTALTGTLQTAAQANVTSVGTLTAINIDSGAGYNIDSTEVLNATTLGSAVVTSSLTTVGALDSGSITSNFGSVDVGTSNISGGRLGINQAIGKRAEITESADDVTLRLRNTNATFSDTAFDIIATRAANSAYNFCKFTSNAGTDAEHVLRGDGVTLNDSGTYSSPADYAEYFDTHDGNDIPPGTVVSLIDGKVIPVNESDDNKQILGVIRPEGASAFVGNSVWSRNRMKYKVDVFGVYEKDESGNRIKNKDYSDDQEVSGRVIVGLLGQVEILKGSRMSDNWIKMFDINDEYERIYIR